MTCMGNVCQAEEIISIQVYDVIWVECGVKQVVAS